MNTNSDHLGPSTDRPESLSTDRELLELCRTMTQDMAGNPREADEALCPDCEGDGGDKWNDYCLPCPTCGGDGRLW